MAATNLPLSQRNRAWKRFIRDKAAVVGAVVVLVAVLLAVAPVLFANQNPTKMDMVHRLSPPSALHPLGTDEMGRDSWSRVVHGTRISLSVGVAGVAVATGLGTAVGIFAALSHTRVDNIVMRVMDIFFAFPAILLALCIMSALGAGIRSIIIALAIVNTPRFARYARGATLVVRQEPYLEAARAAGASSSRIVITHVLPNILGTVLVQSTLMLGFAILTEATLSFLGLGVQPPTPAWGAMLSEGKAFMEVSPWIVVGPGFAIMSTVLGFNMLGDGLRDLLDPRLR